jgi:hypothetical protein
MERKNTGMKFEAPLLPFIDLYWCPIFHVDLLGNDGNSNQWRASRVVLRLLRRCQFKSESRPLLLLLLLLLLRWRELLLRELLGLWGRGSLRWSHYWWWQRGCRIRGRVHQLSEYPRVRGQRVTTNWIQLRYTWRLCINNIKNTCYSMFLWRIFQNIIHSRPMVSSSEPIIRHSFKKIAVFQWKLILLNLL